MAEQVGKFPVGGSGIEGENFAEAGFIHRDRRFGDGDSIGEHGVGPARRLGSLHAVSEQHRHVVGETIHRGRGLHDHERDVSEAVARHLADVGDGAAANCYNAVGAGERLCRGIDGGVVGLKVVVVSEDDGGH